MSELVAPQVPVASNQGIDNFLKGYSLMASLATKRQQQELQLLKMQDSMQTDAEKLDLAKQSFALKAEQNSNLLEIAQGKLGVQQDRLNFDKQKISDVTNAESNVIKAVGEIKATPGSADYQSELMKVFADHPAALQGVQGKKLFADTIVGHANTAKVQQGLFNQELKQLGVPYDAFENPNIWQTDPKKPGKKFLAMPSQEPAKDVNGKPTGQFLTKFVTIEDSKFDNLYKRYTSLFGDPSSRAAMPRAPLDPDTAKKYLDKANGDKALARQMATQDGYSY